MIKAVPHYNKWVDPWPWHRFSPWEMSDRVSGSLKIDTDFMDWLMEVRREFDQPMVITSGYRTPDHQSKLPGNRKTGPHVDAQAVDVGVSGSSALKLIKVATGLDCLGLGPHQKGAMSGRFIHIDRWTNAPYPVRPTVWTY